MESVPCPEITWPAWEEHVPLVPVSRNLLAEKFIEVITVNKTELHALFVEDSPHDIELAVLALERDGFVVRLCRVETEDGLRDALAKSQHDVVLSDYSMPRFDGLSALQVVREVAPETPFIFVSGTLGEDRAIDSILRGATDYVLKDNLRRLGTAVRRALEESEERRRARKMEEERMRLVAILESTTDMVCMSDTDGRLIYMNAGGRSLLNVDGDVNGLPLAEFYGVDARQVLEADARPAAVRDGIWGGELVLQAYGGGKIPVSQVLIAHRDEESKVQYFSTIARDIRERKIYEQRIQYLANYDAITELPNRSLFADRVTQSLSYARRTRRTVAVLVLNIDRFKLVNDGYGHDAGDILLKIVGSRLRDVAPEGDTVARLGADSFAVLAADVALPEDAEAIVRKFQEVFRKPFVLNGREVHLTVSVGASIFPRDGTTVQALLQNADAAMHCAKNEGGDNNFQFYAAEMTRAAAERVELENELRTAIPEGALLLHYQPQVSLESGMVVGVEALMRWKHPVRGWVSPGVFIPIAEGSGLIHALGDWALESACMELGKWQSMGSTNLSVAVNVSAQQFHSAGFSEAVRATIERTGIDPKFLELELTESVVVEDQEEAIRILGRLKDIGLKVAVDDFGTGYSSLSYLSRLPIDCLKVDQSFVQRIHTKRHGGAIVQAIISLGDALGLRVIAEGIETVEQLEFLRFHGCQDGQGFLLSRPLPVAEVERLLTTPITTVIDGR